MALAMASIPIYIHLPSFAASRLGLSLAEVGTILLLIRIVDFLQDPLLGWMTDRWSHRVGQFAGAALIALAVGCILVFAVEPIGPAALWLTAGLLVTFTGYSLGTILLYGQSAAFTATAQPGAQLGLAGVREMGILVGVTLGAAGPALLSGVSASGDGYAPFGIAIALLALVALVVARPLWSKAQPANVRLNWSGFIGSGGAWLLVLAFINNLPVAVTSTLFLFFVEDRLGVPNFAGPFLILFFISAGISAPFWSRITQRVGARRILPLSMSLAIVAFIGAFALPTGATLAFAVICVASGVALGADMVVLSALFAANLQRAGLQAGQAFGLWNFSSKATLAIAAGVILPTLQFYGFRPGEPNTAEALTALNLSYAIVPCVLKIAAIVLVMVMPRRILDTEG
ncbi:MAG: sodium:galactoside symporter [Maritimibacter sp.]|nr:MFS transporter [Maritimibacter sp. UBA3975]MAM62250.1 sodium:galactoside symporter [Maritimibacter sp.]